MSEIIYKGITLWIPDQRCPCNGTLELKRRGATWVQIFNLSLARGQTLALPGLSDLILGSGDSVRFRRIPFKRSKVLGWGTGL